MNTALFIRQYWRNVVGKDALRLSPYFDEHAVVRWHNTNEQFTAAEFVRANSEYPGEWQAEVLRVEQAGATVIAAARVWGEGLSFHVVSFFEIADNRITQLDEYWGDDGPPPGWRLEKQIGKPIR